MIFDVNPSDFDAEVVERSKTAPVVVIFWAQWCVPCRTLKPVLTKLSHELKFDLARCDAGAEGAAAQFGIRGVPTVAIYKSGVKVDGFVGTRPEPFVRGLLAKHDIQPSLELD
jgi:putative thioredoxin